MLSKIHIQNFALIDSLDIELKSGFQVITGETGAGKSILLGALRLILGERADSKAIANPEQKSIVEAEFYLKEHFKNFFSENDLDFEEQTIVRREILPSGKSRAFVNDVPVTLDVLKNLSENLIDIHSQFETSNLFQEQYQFQIIDGLSENKQILGEYQAGFQEFKKLQKTLEQLKNKFSEAHKEADYQIFLLKELQEADLDSTNLEELQMQLQMQENAEQISEHLSQILTRFDQDEIGILDCLSEVRSKLSKTAELSHHFSKISDRFESQFLELKDFVFELQNEAEKIEINPSSLLGLKDKVNIINALLLKHKVNSVEELIIIRDQISMEQNSFAEMELSISETEKQIQEIHNKLSNISIVLSQNRNQSAPIFSQKIEQLLKQLGLEKAKIEVQIADGFNFNEFGTDRIAIMFQANSGFPLKPIQSAISGGERSRVMLAIKKLMAENAELPTLILDEIDTGVSGKIADEIGNVMQEMAKNRQLIVITHLAQVAAKGENNYKVIKTDISGKTQTQILPLSSEEKLTEIAQLLSGSKITEAALKQAKELMN